MNQSEQINELFAALAKAQGEMTIAIRDSENPFFHSRYADLAAVWDAVRGPLSRNGLAVVQGVENEDDGRISVETILGHASGQWVKSRLSGRPAKDDCQSQGSATTYLKRYALAGIVGIAPSDSDDDGNAACGNHAAKAERAPKPAKSNALPARRAEAWGAIEEAESPVALANVAMKIHEDTLLPPETHAELIAEARERMMAFAAGTIKKVDTVEAADKAAKWYAKLPMLTDAQRVSLAGSFAMVREGLAAPAPEPAGAQEIAARF